MGEPTSCTYRRIAILRLTLPCHQDPYNLDGYLASNPFLPDINNELPAKNATYAANLAALDRLVRKNVPRLYRNPTTLIDYTL